MRLHHLHLNVPDRAAVEHFYGVWFGLQVDRRDGALSFLVDDADFLLVLQQDPAPEPLPGWFHLGFPQPDAGAVAALWQRMQAAGVPVLRPYAVSPAITAFRVADPAGHCVEVYWLPAGHRTAAPAAIA